MVLTAGGSFHTVKWLVCCNFFCPALESILEKGQKGVEMIKEIKDSALQKIETLKHKGEGKWALCKVCEPPYKHHQSSLRASPLLQTPSLESEPATAPAFSKGSNISFRFKFPLLFDTEAPHTHPGSNPHTTGKPACFYPSCLPTRSFSLWWIQTSCPSF